MRYTLVALVLALIYHALVRFGGGEFDYFVEKMMIMGMCLIYAEQYNVLPYLVDQLSWRSRELAGQFGF